METIALQEGALSIHCNVGRFERNLDTCYALEWELLETLRTAPHLLNTGPDTLLAQLPLRKRLHKEVHDPVVDGTGRVVGIGISALTSFLDGTKRYLLVRRRSTKHVAMNAGQMHVVPSCMFEPEQGYLNEEFNVLAHIKKEFLEELFGIDTPRNATYDWYEGYEQVKHLTVMINGGTAEIWLTGVIVDAMTLRPEICALILIRSPSWYKRWRSDLKINEEFAEAWELGEEFVPRVSFSMEMGDEELLQEARVRPGATDPAGAAAFWFGVDALRRLS